MKAGYVTCRLRIICQYRTHWTASRWAYDFIYEVNDSNYIVVIVFLFRVASTLTALTPEGSLWTFTATGNRIWADWQRTLVSCLKPVFLLLLQLFYIAIANVRISCPILINSAAPVTVTRLPKLWRYHGRDIAFFSARTSRISTRTSRNISKGYLST